MGKFTADPDVLRVKGEQIIEQSLQFKRNVENIFSTVNEMVRSDYLSPEAIAIAKEIEGYRSDLEMMVRIIDQYGNFCKIASSKVIKNQEDGIASVNYGGKNG